MSRRISIFGASFASVSYLLDDPLIASDLLAAWAPFRLKTGYTGRILNVRRTVGATTTVVSIGLGGANSITLDSPVTAVVTGASSATTLGEFVAATGYPNPDGIAANQDGRAAAGFEQVSGAQVWQQTTATRQPWIVTAGVLDTENGIAALRYAGAQKCEYGVLGGATKPTDYSVIQVMTVDAYNGGFTGMFGSCDAGGNEPASWGMGLEVRGLGAAFNDKLYTSYGNGTTQATFRSTNNYWVLGQQQLHEQYKTNGVFGIDAYLNNGSVAMTTVTGAITSTGGTNFGFGIGNTGERVSGIWMTGTSQLTMVYNDVKSPVRASIVTKINQIMGTTW